LVKIIRDIYWSAFGTEFAGKGQENKIRSSSYDFGNSQWYDGSFKRP
jgi:hypothetical protein